MNYLNTRITLFLVSCMGVQEFFGAQLFKLTLGRRVLPIVATQMKVQSRPLNIEGASLQGQLVVEGDIEDIINEAKNYLARVQSARAAENRAMNYEVAHLKKLLSESKLSREVWEDRMREVAERVQQSEHGVKVAREKVDEFVESSLGKVPEKMGNWNAVLGNPSLTAQVMEEVIQRVFTSEDPFLKTLRAAEIVLDRSCVKDYSPCVFFIASLLKKDQAAKGFRMGSLGLLTPNQFKTFFAGTGLNFLAMPPLPTTMRDFQEPQDDHKPRYVFLSSLLDKVPHEHRDIPFVAVPAQERNSVEKHFMDSVLYDESIVQHADAYTKTMKNVVTQFHELAKIVTKKPCYHSKSYVLAALGLAGGLVAYNDNNAPLRWVSLGLLGSFGLGAWALRSDMQKRNLYYRHNQAFSKASALIENTMQNFTTAFHLSNLRRVNMGIQEIVKEHQLTV